MAKLFYRKKIEGQPDQLIGTDTNKALTPQEFGSGAGFKELQAISGAKYNTRELQQASFTDIRPIGNTLYGLPKQTIPSVPALPQNIDSATLNIGMNNADITSQLPQDTAGTIKQVFVDNAGKFSKGSNQTKKPDHQQLKDAQEKKRKF